MDTFFILVSQKLTHSIFGAVVFLGEFITVTEDKLASPYIDGGANSQV